jgi:hypothetical protein
VKLAQTIRIDTSDLNVFERPAELGEWAISGAFEFSDWGEKDLACKRGQAFANGWLGLESFGRATLVSVTPISEHELAALTDTLARHFVDTYGAPSLDAARPKAVEEIDYMRAMCEDHADNTFLIVEREIADLGVRERFRLIEPREAMLEQFAVHGTLD